jgi:hypothetical protein
MAMADDNRLREMINYSLDQMGPGRGQFDALELMKRVSDDFGLSDDAAFAAIQEECEKRGIVPRR